MKCIIVNFIFFFTVLVQAQITRIEPPNWWVGFKDPNFQLLIHGEKIGEATVEVEGKDIQLVKVHKADSPNYLFLDLKLVSEAKPGEISLRFSLTDGRIISKSYEIKSREKPAEEYVGFDATDAIYLITPDRFANGDPTNDVVATMRETQINRKDDYARHGGDIKGITQHLDYIADLGFTAVWSSPLLTNDMPRTSYHGYAITDYYEVDPRFGNLQDYQELVATAQLKGIKIIMDQVANHCGIEHWWMKDLPFENWINFQDEFTEQKQLSISNHRRTTNQDPYAAKADKDLLSNGWFVPSMPDLNQKNPFLATYIIQNSLWWIETLGLGGIRQDTYPYPDKYFMAHWAGRIMDEYPNFNIVGEEWSYNPLVVGYWQQGAVNKDGYVSNLKTPMDFPMQRAIIQGLAESDEWDRGLVKVYEALANDFHYPDPRSIMVFADNHDMDRVLTQLNGDIAKTKMAVTLVAALPRIPQLYYGTEILMENSDKPNDHGRIRTDFPGGWQGDSVNAFTQQGLSASQRDMQNFVKTVFNYRKHSAAMKQGETIHFAPQHGVYVLARKSADEVVFILFNKNAQPTSLSMDRFNELELHNRKVKNIISGEIFNFPDNFVMNQAGPIILTTKIQP